MGQPCSPFGPAVLSFFPGFCLGRKIGPTGTSGHPFGPGALVFWAAAGAIVTIWPSSEITCCCSVQASCHLHNFCLMWTVVGLDAERGGSDVGSRFIPSADWWTGAGTGAREARELPKTPERHVSAAARLSSRFTVEF